eukprot:3004511-Prymnesium_polylepis.1
MEAAGAPSTSAAKPEGALPPPNLGRVDERPVPERRNSSMPESEESETWSRGRVASATFSVATAPTRGR